MAYLIHKLVMKNYKLETKNNDYLETISDFFKKLLNKKIVDLLMVPQELPTKKCVVQTLISEPSKITNANPFAPVLLGNSASLVSDLTFRSQDAKVGVVLRPCEIRAVVELVKLKQIKNENLFIISVDCPGTFEVEDYEVIAAKLGGSEKVVEEHLKNAIKEFEVRHACKACEYPRYHIYDINIGHLGLDIKKEIFLQIEDEKIAKVLDLDSSEAEDTTINKIEDLKAKRIKFKETLFKDLKEKTKDLLGLLDVLSTCKKCYNCQRACPICYCRECIFCSQTFEYELRNYIRWVNRKGTVKMPSDTLLFHITRLNHMVVSCVSCGQCTSACPSNLPVADIFNMIGRKVQEIFDYVPGRNYDEELPQATFKENELEA